MSPSAGLVIHHRMLRTATHLVEHPAIVSVDVRDDDTLEAVTAGGRRIRLVADEHDVRRPSATKVTMSVSGSDVAVRQSFDELVEPSRCHRAVNRLLGLTVLASATGSIQAGVTTLAALLSPAPQLRHAGDHVGHTAPLQVPAVRLSFTRHDGGPSTGTSIEVLVQADGVISCSGPGNPRPEVTEQQLAVIDRGAEASRGTARAALAQLGERVFSDPDIAAVTG